MVEECFHFIAACLTCWDSSHSSPVISSNMPLWALQQIYDTGIHSWTRHRNNSGSRSHKFRQEACFIFTVLEKTGESPENMWFCSSKKTKKADILETAFWRNCSFSLGGWRPGGGQWIWCELHRITPVESVVAQEKDCICSRTRGSWWHGM